jgi:hypothetical protein
MVETASGMGGVGDGLGEPLDLCGRQQAAGPRGDLPVGQQDAAAQERGDLLLHLRPLVPLSGGDQGDEVGDRAVEGGQLGDVPLEELVPGPVVGVRAAELGLGQAHLAGDERVATEQPLGEGRLLLLGDLALENR